MKNIVEMPKTVAELVVLTSQHIKNNSAVNRTADKLPHAMRFSWTPKIIEAVNNTDAISTEEILGQLSNSSFPSDCFWLEGPDFLSDKHTTDPLRAIRLGALVVANQEKSEFKFLLFSEQNGMERLDKIVNSKTGKKVFDIFHVNGRGIACAFTQFVKVSPEGIDLNDDVLLEQIEAADDFLRIMPKETVGYLSGNKNTKMDASLVDDLYDASDFFARFIVLLSSDRLPNNLQAAKTEQRKDHSKLNKKRVKNGKIQCFPTSPLIIDISEATQKQFATNDVKKIRLLLGWTDVRQSKPIRKKDGTFYRRVAHERRIPSPEDRRGAIREVTSRHPIELTIVNDRPTTVRISTPPGPGVA